MKQIKWFIGLSVLLLFNSCNNTSVIHELKGKWRIVNITTQNSHALKDTSNNMGAALMAVAFAMNGCDSISFSKDSMFCGSAYRGIYNCKDSFLFINSGSGVDTNLFEIINDTLVIRNQSDKHVLLVLKKAN